MLIKFERLYKLYTEQEKHWILFPMVKLAALVDYFLPLRNKSNFSERAEESDISDASLIPYLEVDSESGIDFPEPQMNVMDHPTWQLILNAAKHLDVSVGDFRLIQIINEVQRLDPSRGRASISPVVQGMTSNAGKGPPSSCGQPLVRVSHGLYRLTEESRETVPRLTKEQRPLAQPLPSHSKAGGISVVKRRVVGVIEEFAMCLDTYDQRIPFTRSGQYSLHRATIDRRQSFASVRDAIVDEDFLGNFHQTLYAWGIGKRASRLVSLPEFRDRLNDCSEEISDFEQLRLDDPKLDTSLTAMRLWRLIERLGVVQNVSLIVPGTKTLHHLLPDLVPPMDRAWTGAFFQWSMGSPQYERSTFIRTFRSFAEIAQATDPSEFVGDEWRTSLTKVLDNAIIGYCKLHEIAPRGS